MSWRARVSKVIEPILKMVEKGIEPELSPLVEAPEAAPYAGEEASSLLAGAAVDPPPLTRKSPEKVAKPTAGDELPAVARAEVEKGKEVEVARERRSKRSAEEALAKLPKMGEDKGVTGQKKRAKKTVSRPSMKEMRVDREAFTKVLVNLAESHEATRIVKAIKAEERSKTAPKGAAEGAGGSSGPQAAGGLIAQIDQASALTAIGDPEVLQVEAEEEEMTLEYAGGQAEGEANAFVDSMLATGGPGLEMPELGAQDLGETGPLEEGVAVGATGQEGHGGAEFVLGNALAPLMDPPTTQVAQAASSEQGKLEVPQGQKSWKEGEC